MKIFYLYQYTHRLSGKGYIGVTSNLAKRVREHASGKSGARIFNNAMNKYGIDVFDFKILAIFDEAGAAAYHEQAAIVNLKTLVPNGYNLRAGTPYTLYAGPIHAETRAKMVVVHKARWALPGARARHSLTSKTVMASPEVRAKLSTATRRQMALPGARARQGVMTKAQWDDPEVRDRMSVALRASWAKPEIRAKMSVALKAGWARRRFSLMLEPT